MNTTEKALLKLADQVAQTRLSCIRRVNTLAANLGRRQTPEQVDEQLAQVAVEINNLFTVKAEHDSLKQQAVASGDVKP